MQQKVISTPAGKCPVSLRGIDLDTVHAWADKVIASGQEQGISYTPSAIRYWAATQYERCSPEFAEICRHLKSFVFSVDDVAPTPIGPRVPYLGDFKRTTTEKEEEPVEEDLREEDEAEEEPVVIKSPTIGKLARGLLKASDEDIHL